MPEPAVTCPRPRGRPDDVIGALDAFVGGGERRVDLAEVNGRVFVNNGALRVRIARAHPGASPSAAMPEDLPGSVLALVRMALAHSKPGAARPREGP